MRRGGPTPVLRAGGFTLLEMLTVMALIAVMMGFSVGFLNRGQNDLDLARGALRDQIRLAHTTARARGLPTEVVVEPAQPNVPAFAQARVLVPVGAWHFEPNEHFVDSALRPQVSGKDEPSGRFGHALRPDPESQLPLLRLPTGGSPVFDLSMGWALRLELKIEHRAGCQLVRLGRGLAVALDQNLLPEVRVTLADPGPRPGTVVAVAGQAPLPLGEWLTLEVVHDGREAILLVDGREEGRARARGSMFQEARDALEVSLGNAPLRGVVDEMQLLAYQPSERRDFPVDATISGQPRTIAFDRNGELREPIELEIKLGDGRREKVKIIEGGLLQ